MYYMSLHSLFTNVQWNSTGIIENNLRTNHETGDNMPNKEAFST